MDPIIFNYKRFYNWYYNNRNNKKFFEQGTKDANYENYSFENGIRKINKPNRIFKYFTTTYKDLNILNQNDNSTYIRLKHLYINFNPPEEKIFFIFPRRDINGRLWGDHYSFIRDSQNRNLILFHRTNVIPNPNNSTFKTGSHDHVFCPIIDDTEIFYSIIDKNYDIKNLMCDESNTFEDVFKNSVEQNIITDIITFPWNNNINPDDCYECPLPPIIGGGSALHSYKSKKYKIHIGKQGGKYIIVNKKKIYIKNQSGKNNSSNSIDVIAIKDPVKTNKLWYTMSWISKDGQFNKINKSSEELSGLSLKQYVKTLK